MVDIEKGLFEPDDHTRRAECQPYLPTDDEQNIFEGGDEADNVVAVGNMGLRVIIYEIDDVIETHLRFLQRFRLRDVTYWDSVQEFDSRALELLMAKAEKLFQDFVQSDVSNRKNKSLRIWATS